MAEKTKDEPKVKNDKPEPKDAPKGDSDAQDVLAKMKQKEAEDPDNCPFC